MESIIKKEIESRGFNSAQAQRIFQNAKIYMVKEKSVIFIQDENYNEFLYMLWKGCWEWNWKMTETANVYKHKKTKKWYYKKRLKKETCLENYA